MLSKILAGSRTVRPASEGTAWEALLGFYHAVNWGERNMLALYAGLGAYATAVVLTRRAPNAQLALFLGTCAAIYGASAGNAFFAARWRAWGWSQNYFDKSGVFVASVYCAPLLVLAFAQLLYALREAVSMMVTLKRADLRRKYREAKAAEAGGAPAPAAAAAHGKSE